MEYRRLGRYGIRVSEVSLGGWLTHGRTLDQEATTRVVRRAVELGITTFDTADAYNKGEAERALAKAIEGLRREDLVIATKCYFPMSDNPNDRGLSRKHIFESVHASLRRLNTDYIDLFQFHRFDADSPLDETVRAIDDLVRQGKVLYWGVSEWQASQIAEVVGICRDLNAHPPASNQPNYSMLHRWIEAEVMPTCGRLGLGLIVFSPLAQGILTGKYLPGQEPPAGSRGADPQSNMWMGLLKDDALLQRVQALQAFARDHGCTLAQLALAWILRRQEVSSVIVGATRPEQIEENAKASGMSLPPEVFQEAERILAGGE